MNPACARCTKTVYPTEKLNVLDKCWHQGCFTCETCGIKLSMKTYKGYDKLPYCNTHYPSTKFTAVADTPENLRLAKQTQNQSSVVYDSQQSSGHYTAVADDPESLRMMKAQQQASDLKYQSQLHSIRGEATVVGNAQPPRTRSLQPPPPPTKPPTSAPQGGSGVRYVALFDYTAADDDEVSFIEGDFLTDVEIIDDGWMTGRVERTGEAGMLPSNYLEKA